jgi:predicted N-acyltransferase
MAVQFAVFDHISKLPADWQRFASIKTTMQADHIGVQDVAAIENLKSYYLIGSEQEVPVFIAYFQLLSVKPKHFNLGEKKLQQFFLDRALQIVKPTLLVAGNLFRHDDDFFQFAENVIDSEQKNALYRLSVDYMIAHTNASGIFLKDVPKEIAGDIIHDESYHAMQEDVSMEIMIPDHWHSLADYDKDLKHKYLQRSKKMRKSFEGVKIRELNIEEIIKYQEAIFDLYLQVTQKQIVSMGMLNANFFVQLKIALKNNYRVCGFFLDDTLIAFSSAILHHDIYDMNYIGINYNYNQSHHLYFNILFHCLESAIVSNSTKLILGRTALEAKAIMGCTPEYRYSFYKLRNVVVNWFYQRVAKYFSEARGDKWKERHPFKSTFYQ